MDVHAHLRPVLLAGMLASFALPAGAQVKANDLHGYMMGKIDAGSCAVDHAPLARFEPRMVVVHALVDQKSLPGGWARAKVLQPILGGTRPGVVIPLATGSARGALFVEGKEYLISMFRYGNVYVVDRALECQA